MPSRQGVNYSLLSVMLDFIFTFAALMLARLMRLELPFGVVDLEFIRIPPLVIVMAVVIFPLTFSVLSVYTPRQHLRTKDELRSVWVASMFSLLLLAGALYFSYRNLSRLLVIYFFCNNIVFLTGWRLVYRQLYRLTTSRVGKQRTRRVIIVGANTLGAEIAASLQHPWHELLCLGFVDDTEQTPNGLPMLGKLADVTRVVEEQRVDEVIVALPYREYMRLDQVVSDLKPYPVQIRVVPGYFNLALYRPTVEAIEGVPLINLRDSALSTNQRLIKRAFDLFMGTLTLIVTLPLMGVVALVVRLDSPGPIVFRQIRVGENGELFTMYKFRSMYTDAEDRLQEWLKEKGVEDFNYKTPDDPRVTRVGRFIRRTSLDELPQLFNVLRGDMSLVGPRPELPWLVKEYKPWQHKRFAVPPGITGWWQINGRSDRPMHEHTEDDLFYIDNYSILLDLRILWRTLGVVLHGRGAY